MNFVKVFQGSLIIFQLCFDISINDQSECIVWFNNLSIVKVLQSSFNIFLTFRHFLKMDALFGSRTSLRTVENSSSTSYVSLITRVGK
jgi:hypothetical protein